MKRVLLVNTDSLKPNLALMKISAYHKSLGDSVGFNNTDEPDVVYASVIFKRNKHKVDGLRFLYPNAKIIIGGSGYSLDSVLPEDIESMKPDYDLYPEIDYSLGFASRGCNNKCYFCIVRQKEGKFRIHQHPSVFYDERFSKIVFMDNNILQDKGWFYKVIEFCKEHSLVVDFNQGIDIRLTDSGVIEALLEVKIKPWYRFAFDDSKMHPLIKEKCELLVEHGINIRSDVQFYVYCDSDLQYNDAVSRCRFLKRIGTNPFVQFNIDKKPTKRISELRRWANRKACFWSCDIQDYNRKKTRGKQCQ